MRIKVLYDKDTSHDKLQTGWGVSFLVNDSILFDTGENGRWLLKNMHALQVDPGQIRALVISHDHWDHTGGLQEILGRCKGIKVYSCPGFGKEFKETVKEAGAQSIECNVVTPVVPDIFATGEIAGTYKGAYIAEQALVLKTQNGISLITGCAHPGIAKIIEAVKAGFPEEKLYLVCGGFHLKDADDAAIEEIAAYFKREGVRKAGPTHCSGDKAKEIFRKHYAGDFVEIKVGMQTEV